MTSTPRTIVRIRVISDGAAVGVKPAPTRERDGQQEHVVAISQDSIRVSRHEACTDVRYGNRNADDRPRLLSVSVREARQVQYGTSRGGGGSSSRFVMVVVWLGNVSAA